MNSFRRLLLLLLISAVFVATASAQIRSTSIEGVLREAFGGSEQLHYLKADVDLNQDGRREILLWISTRELGGTGGYPAALLERESHGYRLVWTADYVWAPAVLLPTRSHGWHDLAMVIGGGGEQMHWVVYRHNGISYPAEPVELGSRKAKGRVLFGKNWAMSPFGPIAPD